MQTKGERWSLRSSTEHGTCLCVRGIYTLNNKSFRKLLGVQKSIRESILWAGLCQSLAIQ